MLSRVAKSFIPGQNMRLHMAVPSCSLRYTSVAFTSFSAGSDQATLEDAPLGWYPYRDIVEFLSVASPIPNNQIVTLTARKPGKTPVQI